MASEHAEPATGRGARFRRDIQGLRAVAILAVVAYHTGIPHVRGGYVGVDVFFVISGFLITGLIHDEVGRRRALSFAGFYARRARRLLPSAVLVVAATLAVSTAVLSPVRAATVLRDGVASALYVANYRFALGATNYLSAGSAPSPFLHFWSLGVEEQFYLVWPALLCVAALAWRRRRSTRLSAAVALGIVACSSFGASLWLTGTNEPWAFYSLPTRAWELAAGGLVALAVPELRRLPGAVSALLGWAGLAAVVWAVVGLSPTTPFPGTAALLPVGGAVALVAAGCRPPKQPRHSRRPRPSYNATGLLGLSPFQGAGRISYTWYLWHWPFVVLAPALVGHALPLDGRLAAVGLSLAAALATTFVVEEPLRRAAWLGRPRGGLSLVAASSALVVASVFLAGTAFPKVLGTGRLARTALQAPPSASPSPGTADLAQTATAVTAQVQQVVAQSSTETRVPANLEPSLWKAYQDEGPPFYDGCFDSFTATAVHPCNYGETGSSRSIVLFGDSHALQWFPAFENIATSEDFHLVAAAKATCPPIDVAVFSPDLDKWYTQCTTWRNAVVTRIENLQPVVVVLGFSREYGVSNDHVLVDGPAWMNGLNEMISTLESTGARVVVLGDDPYPPRSVPDCLSAHLSAATRCLIPEAPPASNPIGIYAEAQAVTAAGAAYIDTRPWFCSAAWCDALVENMLVYRDDNHITSTYARWLTPVLQAQLALSTGGLVPPPGAGPTTIAASRQ